MVSGDQHHYSAPPPPMPPPPPPPPHHHPHYYQQPSLNPYHPKHIPNPYPNPCPNPNPYPRHIPSAIPEHSVVPPGPYAPHDGYNGFYASAHAYQCPPPAAAAAAAAAGPSDPHYHGDAGHIEQLAALRSSSDSMQMFATHKNPQFATIAGEEDSKKPVEVGALYCGVCEIVCNSQDSLNTHKQGRQHKKKLQKLQELTTGSSMNNLYCQVCDIVCNKQDSLNTHNQGKQHKKKLQKLQESITPSPSGLSCEVCAIVCCSQDDLNAHKNGKQHKKKLKKLQESISPINGLSCQVCHIVCGSKDDLNSHQQGRKHNKNLKKLEEPIMTNVQNGATSVVSQDKAVGKQPTEIAIPATNDYLENKKQNLLNCKIPEDEIIVCTLCNVVSNNQVVFHDHMTGRKHAAMLKQQQSNLSVTTKPGDAVEDAPVTSKESKDKHSYKRAAPTTEDDLKTKKRNLLDCVGNGDLVWQCTDCNVVCNSQISFVSHMAGSRHAIVVNKKQQQQAPVSMDGAT